jgi:hypothetical protein
MAYDLRNEKREFRFKINLWPKVLKLALAYGWIPRGTLPGELYDWDEWDGSYLNNENQKVTHKDAINLAEALEIALTYIPKLDTIVKPIINPQEIIITNKPIGEFVKEGLAGLKGGLYIPQKEERNKLQFEFGNIETREYLREFIVFCREGDGFTID